jgi:glutamate synthase (NADPH/NADH) large chain
MICHNGEINTLRGNVNWMAARATMAPRSSATTWTSIWPLISRGPVGLGLLRQRAGAAGHGRLLAGARDDDADPRGLGRQPADGRERRAFYEYHAALMEPWDGPAAIAFTDGRQIGATLDRNGLRPARYLVTDDGWSSCWAPRWACWTSRKRSSRSGACSPARCS